MGDRTHTRHDTTHHTQTRMSAPGKGEVLSWAEEVQEGSKEEVRTWVRLVRTALENVDKDPPSSQHAAWRCIKMQLFLSYSAIDDPKPPEYTRSYDKSIEICNRMLLLLDNPPTSEEVGKMLQEAVATLAELTRSTD